MPSNFNSTTPAPPSGGVNVIFQTDGNGNDSAYLPGSVLGLPGGLNGDIQYNNNGVFGGSDATISAAGSIQIPEGQIVEWTSAGGYGYSDYTNAAISQLASNTLAFGDGVPGDVSGAAAMTALILFGSSSYGSYDLFHTTIYSGAEQNWSLILPPNPGTNGQVLTTNGTGVTYWSTISGGGGGSVTSFSSGNLSPLFTTSVATPTTTPALSFTLNTQSANLVFAGPTSGVAATPTFRSLVAADLPAGTGTVTSVGLATGSGASDALYTISGSPVTTSGTLVETLNTQAKNTFLGGPISGANATPTFRGLNSADIPVPGSTGDILYNNGGVLGASLSTITAAGSITIPDTQTITWTGSAYSSVGLSQLAADTLAVGNGTESDVSGGMAMTALILYGSSYYSAYDAFHTTIYSGATQNWNLVLPETAGVNGQVLVNIGSGFTEWESVSALGVPWSALTNASANLTLANGTFTTTFNQTSNVAWLWANTTAATSSTTNASPLLELAANYWTGSASAQDLWTLGSALGAGTNGKSILSLTHSGSTGNAYLATNAITTPSATNLTLDVNANGGQITFTQQRGTTSVGNLGFGQGGGIEGISLNVSPQGGTVGMQANFTTQSSATSGSSGVLQHFGNNANSLTATSGTVVGVDIGSSSAVAGDSLSGMTFAATSTSSAIVNGLRIAPTINVGAAVSWTGSATMLLVNPTLTATGSGSPVINLMDLQVGGASKYRVDQTGAVFRAAASGAPTSAGTAGTAGETIYYSGLLYFCSVTGAAGSATWNKLSMTAV